MTKQEHKKPFKTKQEYLNEHDKDWYFLMDYDKFFKGLDYKTWIEKLILKYKKWIAGKKKDTKEK